MHQCDSSAVQYFRQTDIYTHGLYIPWTYDQKILCAWSAALLHSKLHTNTLLSRCKEMWVGETSGACGGGWLEAQGQYRTSSTCLAYDDKGWLCRLPRHTLMVHVTHLFLLEGVSWAFSMVIAACGEGDMPAPPPPSTDCSSPALNARKEHWPGSRTCPHLPGASPPPHLSR